MDYSLDQQHLHHHPPSQQLQQQQNNQINKTRHNLVHSSQSSIDFSGKHHNSSTCCSCPSDKLLSRVFISECFGTFLLVYLGQCALTSFELSGTQNDTINRQLATTLCYGLAYLFAILVSLNISGAHLNPAYTLASATYGHTRWSRVGAYLIAQYLGSFIAALVLHTTYSDKLIQRHSEGLLTGMNVSFRAHGNILSTGKLFSSYPPTEVSLTQLSISYSLATAHLMFMLILVQESKFVQLSRSLKPFYMASALMLIQAAFFANGGPVLNPAQDLSPRLYIALVGWGSAAFNLYHYNYWWLCGLLAPHFGALIGFGLYQVISSTTTTPIEPDLTAEAKVRSKRKRDYTLTSADDF